MFVASLTRCFVRPRICERDFGCDAQRVCLWILKVSEESLGRDETLRQTSQNSSRAQMKYHTAIRIACDNWRWI